MTRTNRQIRSEDMTAKPHSKVSSNASLAGFAVLLTALSLLTGCSIAQDDDSITPTTRLSIIGSNVMADTVRSMARAYSAEQEGVRISVNGDGDIGIEAMLEGYADIANSARPITDNEMDRARALGFTPTEIIIGRDTLAIIVNEQNRIRGLSMAQLRGIYNGSITNWRDVGGKNMTITAYAQKEDDETHRFFHDTVLLTDSDGRDVERVDEEKHIVNAVAKDEAGIGYVSINRMIVERKRELGTSRFISIMRNGRSVSSTDPERYDEYPLSRPLYQYVRTWNDGTKGLIEYELGAAGQRLVLRGGFTSVSAKDRAANEAAIAARDAAATVK